jgi:ADP-dependent NAD(P)H-hydrate dehydratase / NAD(P)H-hydrate epimerase
MPIPILSVSQMRDWEKATWAAGRTETEVISRVGHIVAVRAKQMTRTGDLIVVLAGKGHNGDDARQASQNFSDREIYLVNVTDPDAAADDFRSQLALQPGLIIDGLFGIGLNRPLTKNWMKLFEEINASRVPILSIDVPSGINSDTGEPEGAAIRSSVTLTLGAPKRGLLNPMAWPYVGRLEVAPDIGLFSRPPVGELQWSVRDDFVNYPPSRPVEGHKGTFGHVAIFGGSTGYHGAAVLASRGALRARPGLVSVFTSEHVYLPVACQLQAAMVHPWRAAARLPEGTSAILFGPGFAAANLPRELREEMVALWQESPVPVVVDASGLDWLPPGPVESRAARIITPHPGEAARLLRISSTDVGKNRPKALCDISRRYGQCFVILKGHQTVVGSSQHGAFVNSSGNPFLAQGGSGDVLAGFVAGLVAQPILQKDVLTLLRYAVWDHGATADYLNAKQRNWTVENLVESLGCVAR